MLVISGLALRSVLIKNPAPSPIKLETQTTLKMARFLTRNKLPAPVSVHYTADRGIRGLQVALLRCKGYLQIAIMPEGDEFLSVWQTRSSSAGNINSYLFNTRLYSEFPLLIFWWETMSYALAHRLQISSYTNPGPVIAMAFPKDCPFLQTVPWQRFKAYGERL